MSKEVSKELSSNYLSTYLPIYLSTYLPSYLAIYLSVCLSVSLSLSLSIYPSIHPFIDLSILSYLILAYPIFSYLCILHMFESYARPPRHGYAYVKTKIEIEKKMIDR